MRSSTLQASDVRHLLSSFHGKHTIKIIILTAVCSLKRQATCSPQSPNLMHQQSSGHPHLIVVRHGLLHAPVGLSGLYGRGVATPGIEIWSLRPHSNLRRILSGRGYVPSKELDEGFEEHNLCLGTSVDALISMRLKSRFSLQF